MEWTRAIILVLAIGLEVAWLALALLGRPRPAEGSKILHYPATLRVFALVVALLIPALTVYIVGFLPWLDARRMGEAGSILLALSVLSGLLLLETARVRVQISDAGLVGDAPWRRRRIIPWGEIQEIRYSRINGWFIFALPGGRNLRVSQFLVGLPALMKAVRQHVSELKYPSVQRQVREISQRRD